MKFKKDLASIIMPSCHKLTSKNKICYENSIKQSLDVHLKERNIQGITKYKLFII